MLSTLQARNAHLVRPLIFFIVAFFALQYGWERCRGTVVEHWVIDRATVMPAAQLLHHLWPDQGVYANGHSLVSAHSRLNILNGCEGLETLFLLVAAFVAFPLHWRVRLLGITLSTLLIYVLNQVRIVLLWRAIRTDLELFGLLHGTVLPLVLIAIALLFFVAFLPYRRIDPV